MTGQFGSWLTWSKWIHLHCRLTSKLESGKWPCYWMLQRSIKMLHIDRHLLPDSAMCYVLWNNNVIMLQIDDHSTARRANVTQWSMRRCPHLLAVSPFRLIDFGISSERWFLCDHSWSSLRYIDSSEIHDIVNFNANRPIILDGKDLPFMRTVVRICQRR